MSTKPVFYNAWFCPFAQRAWIALEEKGVDFEYKETNPYDKTPGWLAISPTGLVPVIIQNGNTIYESTVCIEYVDEAFDTPMKLLPIDPYQRAHVRIWSDFVDKKIIPHFYAQLLKQNQEEQETAKEAFLQGIEAIVKRMSTDGPYFLGETYSMVDIVLFPHMVRFPILKYYRNFELPKGPDWAKRLNLWLTAMLNRPGIQKTLQDDHKLIEEYLRYANNSANSEVAKAVRNAAALP